VTILVVFSCEGGIFCRVALGWLRAANPQKSALCRCVASAKWMPQRTMGGRFERGLTASAGHQKHVVADDDVGREFPQDPVYTPRY
jgi:hypothetical protein